MFSRIKEKVLSGRRLTEKDALELFGTDDLFSLGALAARAAEKKNGKKAYFIRNRHINPTNICVNRCRFCAFSRSEGQEGAFELTIKEILHKLKPFSAGRGMRISEVHIVGGLHPKWPFEYYLEMLSSIKR